MSNEYYTNLDHYKGVITNSASGLHISYKDLMDICERTYIGHSNYMFRNHGIWAPSRSLDFRLRDEQYDSYRALHEASKVTPKIIEKWLEHKHLSKREHEIMYFACNKGSEEAKPRTYRTLLGVDENTRKFFYTIPDDQCGVYFLYGEDKQTILYIGESKELPIRATAQMDKYYTDGVRYISVMLTETKESAQQMESNLIKTHKPVLNKKDIKDSPEPEMVYSKLSAKLKCFV